MLDKGSRSDAKETIKCRSVFFAGLRGIALPFLDAPGLSFRGTLKLATDRAFISRFVGSYASEIGGVEYNFLCNMAQALILAQDNVEIRNNKPEEAINGLITQYLSLIQSWVLELWLTRDNALNVDTAWMVVSVNNRQITNNNQWAASITKADGTYIATKYSREDIENAILIGVEEDALSDGKPLTFDLNLRKYPTATKLSKKTARFQRFLYFVGAARAASDVAIKIANYCSALEAMVSSSQTELSHQVAERVSCLLRPLGPDRLSTFSLVKTAYGFRSKAIHGSSFRARDETELRRVAVEIDQVSRELALTYLGSEDIRKAIEAECEAIS